MPVYQYEAMDNTGLEVKDTIEAHSEEEAQTLIKEKGFFVTKIAEKGRGKNRRREPPPKGVVLKKQAPKKEASPLVAFAPNS